MRINHRYTRIYRQDAEPAQRVFQTCEASIVFPYRAGLEAGPKLGHWSYGGTKDEDQEHTCNEKGRPRPWAAPSKQTKRAENRERSQRKKKFIEVVDESTSVNV